MQCFLALLKKTMLKNIFVKTSLEYFQRNPQKFSLCWQTKESHLCKETHVPDESEFVMITFHKKWLKCRTEYMIDLKLVFIAFAT